MPPSSSDHCDFVIDALGITSAVCETFIPCHLLPSLRTALFREVGPAAPDWQIRKADENHA
jgi:hypothetical protein